MKKTVKHKNKTLYLRKNIEQPPQINETLLKKLKQKDIYSGIDVEKIYKSVRQGDRVVLGRAITLVESEQKKHQHTARELIEKCMYNTVKSVRIGVTGAPGVGKSTFIEALGMFLINKGYKIAVLAIDPSSKYSKGSILGDKTRMEHLASEKKAFIRPSPSSGTLGGVARKTYETVLLCETAGYDIIFVETVGVGQSEFAVKNMVDIFLLLVFADATDELQSIKRGILEMADAIIIHKADEENLLSAKKKIAVYESTLSFFHPSNSLWMPKVIECSSLSGHNIPQVWKIIDDYISLTRNNGFFEKNRQEQLVNGLHQTINEYLKESFYNNKEISSLIKDIEVLVSKRKISPYEALELLIEKYQNS